MSDEALELIGLLHIEAEGFVTNDGKAIFEGQFGGPTSALDPEMVNEVLAVMTDLAASDMTMICVTHEMGFAQRVADTVWFLIDGRIVYQGSEVGFFGGCDDPRVKRFLNQLQP